MTGTGEWERQYLLGGWDWLARLGGKSDEKAWRRDVVYTTHKSPGEGWVRWPGRGDIGRTPEL
jgi:hypothetical protein